MIKAHEIDYELVGDDMQMAVITLYPNETVIAEAGGMNWINEDFAFDSKFGDGSATIQGFWNKIWDAGKRVFTGESFFITHFTNKGNSIRKFAFMHPSGTIVKKELNEQTIRINTGCLVVFSPDLDYDTERAGNLKSVFFGDEGLFLAAPEGTGKAYIQSLSLSRLADRIIKNAPSVGGKRKGEGSILGVLGDLINGDNR